MQSFSHFTCAFVYIILLLSKLSSNRPLLDNGSITLSDNGREWLRINLTILGRLSLDPGLLVPRLHLRVCRCSRVSHLRLERLCSSAVFLWVAYVRLQTYLGVHIRMARGLF